MIDPQMFDRMRRHRLCYLMTPYTNFDPTRTVAWRAACAFAGELLSRQVSVFSPIAHSHAVARYAMLDETDRALWSRVNAPYMALCDAGIVAQLPGWTESVGMNQEIGYFDSAKKPLYYLPGDTFK